MISIIDPIAAGIVVVLFNRFILSGNWWCNADSVSKCTDVEQFGDYNRG